MSRSKAAVWPRGTVLYVHCEYEDAPKVTVFGKEEQ